MVVFLLSFIAITHYLIRAEAHANGWHILFEVTFRDSLFPLKPLHLLSFFLYLSLVEKSQDVAVYRFPGTVDFRAKSQL